MTLSSPRSSYNVGTGTQNTGALCTVTADGSVVFSKILHPSPTGYITLNLPYILSSAMTSDLDVSVSYTVTYNGTSIDTGSFQYKI